MRYAFENSRRKAVREAQERKTPRPHEVLDHIEENHRSVVFHMKDGSKHTVRSAGYDGEVQCVTEQPNAA